MEIRTSDFCFVRREAQLIESIPLGTIRYKRFVS